MDEYLDILDMKVIIKYEILSIKMKSEKYAYF